MADAEADEIADCVLKAFDALPASRKPRGPASGLKAGTREWVPLAGIVIEESVSEQSASRFKCVAFATGMKCLPMDKVAASNGNVLHDCHAEILALRAFNGYLFEECGRLVTTPQGASEMDVPSLLRWNTDSIQPFEIRPDIKLHMYCSEAPCGDASMELTMAAQEDSTPWTGRVAPGSPCIRTPPVTHDLDIIADQNNSLYGRGYFDKLGVVRRKPSRPDAPATLSKSCSDKLALKQCTSILSSITAILISPQYAYLESVVMPETQLIPEACQRAFSPQGRMGALPDSARDFRSGYVFRPFRVRPTVREFEFGRRVSPTLVDQITKVLSSNLATVTFGTRQETLINGVLQGRKQSDPRGSSTLSRRRLWSKCQEIARSLGRADLLRILSQSTYSSVKDDDLLAGRRRMKFEAISGPLKGWRKNLGDEQWGVEVSSLYPAST